jgi:hypothetical protein
VLGHLGCFHNLALPVFLRAERLGEVLGCEATLGCEFCTRWTGDRCCQLPPWGEDISLTPSNSPVVGANITHTLQMRTPSPTQQSSRESSSDREFSNRAGNTTQLGLLLKPVLLAASPVPCPQLSPSVLFNLWQGLSLPLLLVEQRAPSEGHLRVPPLELKIEAAWEVFSSRTPGCASAP